MAEVLPQPASHLPLAGVTVLAVEDSRLASEALRLMCQRLGARLRRADCLETARRHLAVYRPTVTIVDIGLPDGSGCDLIAALARMRPRPPLILGSSGESGLGPLALRAGADGFLEKPIYSLQAFQTCLASGLRRGAAPAAAPPAAQAFASQPLTPDPLALRDDLVRARAIIRRDGAGVRRGYLAQFLRGVARCSHDEALARAVVSLDNADFPDLSRDAENLRRLQGLIEARLAASPAL